MNQIANRKIDTVTIKVTTEAKEAMDKYSQALGWTRSKLGAVIIEAAINEIKSGKRSVYSLLPQQIDADTIESLEHSEDQNGEKV